MAVSYSAQQWEVLTVGMMAETEERSKRMICRHLRWTRGHQSHLLMLPREQSLNSRSC